MEWAIDASGIIDGDTISMGAGGFFGFGSEFYEFDLGYTINAPTGTSSIRPAAKA